MNATEFAAMLSGREYGKEITKAEEAQAKAAGLIVLFGYSDDNVEVRGVSNDEVGAYDGTTLYFTSKGLLENKCEDDDCPYYAAAKASAASVEAVWNGDDCDYTWSFRTDIPHATFDIHEDGSDFCRGIVFALSVLAERPS